MARRSSSIANALTADIARAAVAELAPAELASFDVVAGPYLGGTDASAGPDELGFGVGEAIATITPVVTLISASVAAALVRGVEGELERASGEATRGLLRRWFRRRPAPPARQPHPGADPAAGAAPDPGTRRPPGRTGAGHGLRRWTPDQLERVRSIAVTRAITLGLDQARAQTIADAIVGALVLDSGLPQ